MTTLSRQSGMSFSRQKKSSVTLTCPLAFVSKFKCCCSQSHLRLARIWVFSGARIGEGGSWSPRLSLSLSIGLLAAVEGEALERPDPVVLCSQRGNRLVMLLRSALRWRERSGAQLIVTTGEGRRVRIHRGRSCGGVRGRSRYICEGVIIIVRVAWLCERRGGSFVAKR